MEGGKQRMEYSELQQKGFEIAKRHGNLPLQDRLNIIARAFGCKTASIRTSLCFGKFRGNTDISVTLDNGASLWGGMYRTPQAKTAKAQNEAVNGLLARYNPEIVREIKERATAALLKREAEDNAVAAQKGLKPYQFLNVELNDGTGDYQGGYAGWYYITLAVGDKIIGLVESGLNSDMSRGVVSEHITKPDYYTAGALKDEDVDFVFNNVGFSSSRDSYQFDLNADVRQRAEQRLMERANADRPLPDPTVTVEEMFEYGYMQGDMHPLSLDKAVELYDAGYSIYLLYSDDTDILAIDRDEIISFGSEGLCGITKADWAMSRVRPDAQIENEDENDMEI
jgi:hypothetical protein